MRFERNWTTVGEEHSAGHRDKLERVIARLVWKPMHRLQEEGAMASLGIVEAIRQLRIPRVESYATSNELAPYGFLAIRGHFINGEGRIYAVDEGHKLCVICSDFFPKEPGYLETLDVKGDSAHATE